MQKRTPLETALPNIKSQPPPMVHPRLQRIKATMSLSIDTHTTEFT